MCSINNLTRSVYQTKQIYIIIVETEKFTCKNKIVQAPEPPVAFLLSVETSDLQAPAADFPRACGRGRGGSRRLLQEPVCLPSVQRTVRQSLCNRMFFMALFHHFFIFVYFLCVLKAVKYNFVAA